MKIHRGPRITKSYANYVVNNLTVRLAECANRSNRLRFENSAEIHHAKSSCLPSILLGAPVVFQNTKRFK
jgi:hypothetical protein